ncbi:MULTISPECIES: hypothetical protein [unclassified Limnobacter]|uniref:hypothetical protein n=1 Tax=unclassified Limnobacter TaxID=2630203 RepID=UPI000C42EEEA|nr:MULTISPECIES: hypothetical protein [unclassified Limnobacter]MAG80420.1 hypothetical protein [Sutterellaceae bacterium]MBT85298.1 hypothetical protein [Sutterellaceae bacterium]|tara:strand:- start:2160 stop:3023 length:864 start_codon:yes stop_codon:yes gene_type:complete
MIKSYLPFNDFFTSSFCLAFFYAYGVVVPLAYLFDLSEQAITALFATVSLLVISVLYYVVFVAQVNIANALKLSIFILPITCLTTFPEVLGMVLDAPIFLSNESRYFNSWYALAVATISYIWALIDTNVQINKGKVDIRKPIELWTINVYLADHSFEDRDKQKSLTALVITWVLIGVMMIYVFVLPTITTEPDDLKLLLAKVGAMIPTAALVGILFMFMGQTTSVMRLERELGNPLTFRNHHLRMKWRHDYVKYHLPAPIRKLNLRLFNQHVEAYERLQNEVKSSRT